MKYFSVTYDWATPELSGTDTDLVKADDVEDAAARMLDRQNYWNEAHSSKITLSNFRIQEVDDEEVQGLF